MLDSLIAGFLVIAPGWLLKVRNVVSPSHRLGAERLTYQVLFPAVVIHTLAMADLRGVPVVATGASLVLAILSVGALLLLTRQFLARAGIDGPAFASTFQGSLRWNTFVALALVAGAVPTATAAYFLARDLGGDAPLMAEITTLQTLLALATLPVAVFLLKSAA